MKCKNCEFNLGDLCQASLPDSNLFGCDPFSNEDEVIEKLERRSYASIEKTFNAAENYILIEDFDAARILFKKVEYKIMFARELGLLSDEHYFYFHKRLTK